MRVARSVTNVCRHRHARGAQQVGRDVRYDLGDDPRRGSVDATYRKGPGCYRGPSACSASPSRSAERDDQHDACEQEFRVHCWSSVVGNVREAAPVGDRAHLPTVAGEMSRESRASSRMCADIVTPTRQVRRAAFLAWYDRRTPFGERHWKGPGCCRGPSSSSASTCRGAERDDQHDAGE